MQCLHKNKEFLPYLAQDKGLKFFLSETDYIMYAEDQSNILKRLKRNMDLLPYMSDKHNYIFVQGTYCLDGNITVVKDCDIDTLFDMAYIEYNDGYGVSSYSIKYMIDASNSCKVIKEGVLELRLDHDHRTIVHALHFTSLELFTQMFKFITDYIICHMPITQCSITLPNITLLKSEPIIILFKNKVCGYFDHDDNIRSITTSQLAKRRRSSTESASVIAEIKHILELRHLECHNNSVQVIKLLTQLVDLT